MNVSIKFNSDRATRLSFGVMSPEFDPELMEPAEGDAVQDQLALVLSAEDSPVIRQEVFGYLQDGVLYWFSADHQRLYQIGEVGNPIPESVVEALVDEGVLVLYQDVAAAQTAGWGVFKARAPYRVEQDLVQDLVATYESTARLLVQKQDRLDVGIKHAYVIALEDVKKASEDMAAQQLSAATLSDEQRSKGMKAAMQSLYVVNSLNSNHL